MGKNGTGWDVFEGFQSNLAMFGNETPRESAAQWMLLVSCLSIGSRVVKSGRFQPLSSPTNRAIESPRGVSSSIAMSHVPAPQTCYAGRHQGPERRLGMACIPRLTSGRCAAGATARPHILGRGLALPPPHRGVAAAVGRMAAPFANRQRAKPDASARTAAEGVAAPVRRSGGNPQKGERTSRRHPTRRRHTDPRPPTEHADRKPET